MTGLVFIGMIEPGSHNQEERRFVEALSTKFSRTYYFRGIGIRGMRQHSLRSLPARLLAHSFRPRRGGEGLQHGSLLIVPFRRMANRLNARWIARQIDGIVGGYPDGWTLWIRFPSPELVAALDHILVRRIVYEPIDLYSAAEELSRDEASRLVTAEGRLMRRSTVVTGGRLLAERFIGAAGGSLCLPFGTDLARPDSGPGLPTSIPRPRIGLVGCLDWRVDEGLLLSVVRAHPEWHLVLAGPRAGAWGRCLLSFPNVHRLGRIPYDRVPAVIRDFDVALLPYRETDWTRHALPVKVFEYLAEGKPVVATPLPELALLGDTVSIAVPESFAAAVGEALRDTDPRKAQARRRAAYRFSLQGRAQRAARVAR